MPTTVLPFGDAACARGAHHPPGLGQGPGQARGRASDGFCKAGATDSGHSSLTWSGRDDSLSDVVPANDASNGHAPSSSDAFLDIAVGGFLDMAVEGSLDMSVGESLDMAVGGSLDMAVGECSDITVGESSDLADGGSVGSSAEAFLASVAATKRGGAGVGEGTEAGDPLGDDEVASPRSCCVPRPGTVTLTKPRVWRARLKVGREGRG